VIERNGRPVGTRTPDLYSVKVALYPTELRARFLLPELQSKNPYVERPYLTHPGRSRKTNLPLGLLRATVFRHFLDFVALRGTSRHFMSENHKLAIVKKIVSIFLVIRGFPRAWGLSPPLSARLFRINQLAGSSRSDSGFRRRAKITKV
jgi:hypothetical protein